MYNMVSSLIEAPGEANRQKGSTNLVHSRRPIRPRRILLHLPSQVSSLLPRGEDGVSPEYQVQGGIRQRRQLVDALSSLLWIAGHLKSLDRFAESSRRRVWSDIRRMLRELHAVVEGAGVE